MKVVDASVIIDAFSGVGQRGLRATYMLEADDLVAPAHIDIEALSGWRRQVAAREMSAEAARHAIQALSKLVIERIPHEPLLNRIWELRENVTAQDAAYVAIAEMLGAPLLTTDARLSRVSGPRCEFQLIA
ncbi:MAG: type II toxin-antitoxin system VapC family toxin [Thermoleophilaceae bacterium]|nr:type II toxin-antitoxin system VapC family toxin [Thermoleophilaceae bacterium]